MISITHFIYINMRKFYAIMASVALMSAFTACNNEDEIPSPMTNGDGSELIVKSVGVASVDTKAGITAEQFTNNETLGLYIYRGNGINGTTIASGDEKYNDGSGSEMLSTVNVPYQTNGNSWSATQPIILSNVKGKVYAYYPYVQNNNTAGTSVDNGLAVKVSVSATQGTGQSNGKKDQDQTDYMWATPWSDVSNAAPSVNLVMNHALTMITFKFVQTSVPAEKYPGEGKVSQIVLKNQSGKQAVKIGDATMNIATGVITGGTAGSITLTPNHGETLMGVGDAEKLPRLLVYPSAANITGDDAEVTVTVDGNTYTAKIPALTVESAASKWKPGNNYIYTLTMKGTKLVVSSVAITRWHDVDGNTGENMPVQTPDRP